MAERTSKSTRWGLVGQWGLVGIYLAAALLNLGWFFFLIGDGRYHSSDVKAYYTGARIVADKRGARLYDVELQRQVQGRLPRPFTTLLPYNHPPFTAALLAPLARLPFVIMYLVFSAGQLFAYAWAVSRLRPWWGRWSRTEQLCFLAIASSFVCVYHAVHWGSPSLFVFLFVAEAVRRSSEGQLAPAGAWLALATIKPQLATGLIWSLLWSRRWKAIMVAILTVAGLTGFSLAVVGFEGTFAFPKAILGTFQHSTQFGIDSRAMPNMRGLVSVLGLSANDAGPVALVFSAAVWIFLAWGWSSRFNTPGEETTGWSITIPLLLLASPHLHSNDVSLALLGGMLLYDRARTRPASASIGRVLFVAPLVSQIGFLVAGRLAEPQVWALSNIAILIAMVVLSVVERFAPPAPAIATKTIP